MSDTPSLVREPSDTRPGTVAPQAGGVYRAAAGRRFYGVPIGILLVDCNVPFPPGDVGNASSYGFPVCFELVEGASAEAVVFRGERLEQAFIDAARRLQQNGVRAITGDCGYMIRYQDAVAEAIEVPVFLSSLLQVPMLLRMLGPSGKLGLLVASGRSADDELLELAGVDGALRPRLCVAGLEDRPHFRRSVLEESGELDRRAVEAEVVATAVELVEREPSIAAIAFECSNLPPYAAAVRRATGRPVFDWIGFVNYVHHAVAAGDFSGLY
jgi:hypothetical protein